MGIGRLALLVVVVGCGRVRFDDTTQAGGDGSSARPVSHLPQAAWAPGTGTLVIAGNSVLDTTAVQLDGKATLAEGRLLVSAQASGGSDVVVLAVGGLAIMPNGVLRVLGTRPLVVVAADTIEILGTLDGAARQATPGGGGADPGTGGGVGQPGLNGGLYDSGGGGAGFGTGGGTGGPHVCNGIVGGPAGAPQGDPVLSVLIGGSGGGTGSPGTCVVVPGGAGGGALQLSAGIAIRVDGLIGVGGGGGGGGEFCNGNDGGAGSGGGAGGAIFLEAPLVDVAGVLAANGGGGGGGGGPSGPPGDPGSDGTSSLAAAAAGGNTGGGATGGTGGWRDAAPAVGGNGTCSGPAGGGGGAVGRIAIRTITRSGTGTITPAAIGVP